MIPCKPLRLGLSLSCALAIAPQICHARVTKLPAVHRKALEDASRFRLLRTTKDLPPVVVALCADHEGRLADPGRAWQATDVIIDHELAWKRMIWAVTDGDYYVVHYESGGEGHGFHVLVTLLKKGNSKPSFIWRGGSWEPVKDFKTFLEALKANRLDDRWPGR